MNINYNIPNQCEYVKYINGLIIIKMPNKINKK